MPLYPRRLSPSAITRIAATLALAGAFGTAMTGCASAQQGGGAADVPGLPGPAADMVPGASASDPFAVPPGLPGAPTEGGTLPDGTAIDSGAPAVGVRPGALGGPEVLPGVLDSQIKKCWSVPVLTGDPAEGGLARIRVEFLPDGTLAKPPAIIDKPAGRLGGVFAESAAAAIAKCAPYKLPPESYPTWREMMIVFDTLDF